MTGIVDATRGIAKKMIRGVYPVIRRPLRVASDIGVKLDNLAARRRFIWSTDWTKDYDDALEALPAPPHGVTREQYRLLTEPGGFPKRHILALDHNEPAALISVRWRGAFWEPVTYQALPGFIAPARDICELGIILNHSGLPIQVDAGLGRDVADMGPRSWWPYEVFKIDLQKSYEDHWQTDRRKQARLVAEARKKCAGMDLRFDGPGDLAWLVNLWRDTWLNDPAGETCAAPDRLRFWTALQAAPQAPGQLAIHTCVLLDQGRPVAGSVFTRVDDTLLWQISVREDAYSRSGVGTRTLDAALEWARDRG